MYHISIISQHMRKLSALTTITILTRVAQKVELTSMAKQLGNFVESLVHQCYHYIAMNLEQFPVSYLSLLPLKVREELLWRLPIADLCMLEDTEYVEGFHDMASYWKLPCKDFRKVLLNYADVAHYVEESWDSAKYAKAILYGQVAITAFGNLYDIFINVTSYCVICLPFNGILNPNDRSVVIPLLYAVRKPSVGKESGCSLAFPPRYRDTGSKTSTEDIINSVQSWFKCGFPKIMLQVCLCEDIDSEYFDLLDEVALLATSIQGFKNPTMRFVKQIVQRSSCLEVIVLDSWCEEEKEVLNEFLEFLSTQDSFLSRFRLLVISQDEEYTLFQNALGPLITAYMSAPTTHLQKISITGAMIKSYETDVTPVIDQRYVQFKTIELNGCRYDKTQKFSRKAITEWLGEDISMLNESKEKKDSLTFKVREQDPGLPDRKRKHSEVDSEDSQ